MRFEISENFPALQIKNMGKGPHLLPQGRYTMMATVQRKLDDKQEKLEYLFALSEEGERSRAIGGLGLVLTAAAL